MWSIRGACLRISWSVTACNFRATRSFLSANLCWTCVLSAKNLWLSPTSSTQRARVRQWVGWFSQDQATSRRCYQWCEKYAVISPPVTIQVFILKNTSNTCLSNRSEAFLCFFSHLATHNTPTCPHYSQVLPTHTYKSYLSVFTNPTLSALAAVVVQILT